VSTEPETLPAPATEDVAAPNAPTQPPQQQEMPLAIVRGEPFFEPPKDLYIPPDALEVILESFEGPLDLLLYLIRRQNLDILDIPIAEVTRQYIGYIELMGEMRFELAADYLVMAAILAEIKSRLLLPRPPSEEGAVEADPRAELVRRLQEYERFKKAAQDLDALPRLERDFSIARADVGERKAIIIPPDVDLKELLLSLKEVLQRADLFTHHQISREPLSVRQRMSELLAVLAHGEFRQFIYLFDASLGRRAVVVTFLAILELSKEGLLEIVQEAPLEPIFVRTKAIQE
jgi:segregation and condensation protein A